MYPLKDTSQMPKILYIMGTARSGSTVLEILLSHAKDTFGAGEITSLVQDGFIENKTCSCGQHCHSCNVWRQVLENINMREEELREWAALQKKVDWHVGFFRQIFGLLSPDEKARYRDMNRSLLWAISKTTQASTIVDSSKYAGRALALEKIVNAEVNILCLTRSPSGIMTSFQKPNTKEQLPKTVLGTLNYYVMVLTILWLAKRLLGKERVLSIRYEEFVAHPEQTLRAIGQWSNLDLSEVIQGLQEKKPFSVGHLVTGNRLRKKGEIRLKGELGNAKESQSFKIKTAVTVMDIWRKMLNF